MMMYFRIRSVFENSTQTTLTLDPVRWFKDHPTETETIGEETFPTPVESDPSDPAAQPFDTGGKTTELRFDGHHPGRVGGYLTVTVEAVEYDETPA